MNPNDEAKCDLQYSTAVDANGESEPSQATATLDQTQPRNLRNPGRSFSEAWLTWDAPSEWWGLLGYEITCPGRDTAYTIARTHIARNLIPEVAYLFKVRPLRIAAMPPALSQSITVVTHDLAPPTKPGALKLTTLTPDSASLSWTASTSNSGSLRYRVYLNESLVTETEQLHCTLAHLQDHTVFQVKVRAVNTSDIMSRAASVRFNTVLRAPKNLRFSHLNGFCRLAWDPNFRKYPTHVVAINGKVFTTGRGLVGYNFKLADLSPGPAPHHFNFAVYARLDDSISKTTELEITLTDDVPPSPPGTPIVSNITDTSATLTWEPSSDNVGVTGYRVSRNFFFVYPTPNTHFTFEGLTSGTYYYAHVRARDKDGNLSALSERAVFKTTGQAPKPRPSAPSVSITALTSTEAELQWSFVDEEPLATGARIMINGEHYKDVIAMFNGRSLVLDNLIPDVECLIAVHAFDIYGQLSEPTTLVHEPKDITPPSVPENLREMASTFDSVTLAWEASTDDVGICGYVIYNNREYFDRTPLTRYTAVDLLPGAYSFDVCALDTSGNASEPASIVVEVKS